MTASFEELAPLVAELKATLRQTDVSAQGGALAHALAWWLYVYAGESRGARERGLTLVGGMALEMSGFYGEAAQDGVDAENEPIYLDVLKRGLA